MGDLQLLLTVDLYDRSGKHIAKLRRNAWTFNDRDRFDITTNPASLTLTEKETGKVILEANVLGRNEIEVPRGEIFTPSGIPIVIEPTFMRVGGVTLSENYIEAGGAAIVIGAGSLGIGASAPSS